MTYKEFCYQLAPIIVELQNEVQKMTEDGFIKYRAEVMKAIKLDAPEICERFMSIIFDMIYKNVFQIA